MLKPLSFVLMLALAAPAAAQITFQSAPTAAPAVAAASTKDPNRIICERQEQVGSRLGGKKVCKTAAEWDEERREQRDSVQKFQQQNTSSPSSG